MSNPLVTFLPLIVIVAIGLLMIVPRIKRDREQPHLDLINFNYASFWLRLLAFCVDFVIISIIFSIIVLTFNLEINEKYIVADYGILVFYRGPIVFLIGYLYYSLLESSKLMATLGKRLVKIKVTDLNGDRITFGNATVRFFGKLLSSLFLGMGFLMIFFMSTRQGLHDTFAKTIVIMK